MPENDPKRTTPGKAPGDMLKAILVELKVMRALLEALLEALKP